MNFLRASKKRNLSRGTLQFALLLMFIGGGEGVALAQDGDTQTDETASTPQYECYFEKPSGWTEPISAYTYKVNAGAASTEYDGAWSNCKELTKTGSLYKYASTNTSMPSSGVLIMFKDNGNNQYPAKNETGLSLENNAVYNTSGKVASPDPKVEFTASGITNNTFYTETLDLTAKLVCAASATYKIGDGGEQTLSDETSTITIGSGVATGTDITITWKATVGTTTKEGSVTYRKAKADRYCYFVKPTSWDNVYVYAWTGSGNSSTTLMGTWPGTQLTELSNSVYTWNVPETYGSNSTSFPKTFSLIFSAGKDKAQTVDLTFWNGATYEITAEQENSKYKANAYMTATTQERFSNYTTLYYGDRALQVPDKVKAMTYKVADGKLTVSTTYDKDGVIPSGEAVVLLSESAGTYKFMISSPSSSTKDTNNLLFGYDEATTPTADNNNLYYKLSLNGSNAANSVGFYWGAADGAPFKCTAHKAYLKLSKTGETANVKSFSLIEETTGIETTVGDKAAVNAPLYNLSGQRVGEGYKGIVIQNGHKFVKK